MFPSVPLSSCLARMARARSEAQPLKGSENWQSAFLPRVYQATSVDTQYEQVEKLLSNIRSSVVRGDAQAKQMALLSSLNRLHQSQARQSDERLEAKIRTSELAFRMQTEAMQTFDLSVETEETRALYRYAGRDFRLTDVHGKVVNGILA